MTTLFALIYEFATTGPLKVETPPTSKVPSIMPKVKDCSPYTPRPPGFTCVFPPTFTGGATLFSGGTVPSKGGAQTATTFIAREKIIKIKKDLRIIFNLVFDFFFINILLSIIANTFVIILQVSFLCLKL